MRQWGSWGVFNGTWEAIGGSQWQSRRSVLCPERDVVEYAGTSQSDESLGQEALNEAMLQHLREVWLCGQGRVLRIALRVEGRGHVSAAHDTLCLATAVGRGLKREGQPLHSG